jgi:putative two-component system response regulator
MAQPLVQELLEGSRILVVEDDPGVQVLLGRMLKKLGCLVETVATVHDAREHLAAGLPDALMLDVHLQGDDGLQVLQYVRETLLAPMLPVIVLTGSSARETRLRAAAMGVNVFLSKPFDNTELSLRLGSLLRLKRTTDTLEEGGRVLVSLARTLEARDPYTLGHSERVASRSGRIGTRLGLSAEQVVILEQGGLVHDIGKIGIRDGLLLKPGRLDLDEVREVQQHPVIGVRIVENLRTMQRLIPVVRHHHEKLDGSGYPDGIQGQQIGILPRVAAVADVFDALTTSRPYRPAFAVADALACMAEDVHAGKFDRECYEALVAEVEAESPTG